VIQDSASMLQVVSALLSRSRTLLPKVQGGEALHGGELSELCMLACMHLAILRISAVADASLGCDL
jgi:hypothetical protein